MWLVTITVTMLSDVTDMWQHDLITLTLTQSSKNRKIVISQNKNKNK